MDNVKVRVFHEATLDDLSTIRQFVRETVASTSSARGVSLTHTSAEIEPFVMAVNEALENIIRHGYQKKPGDITVGIMCSKDTIGVTLCDNSPGFDPTTVSSPDMTLPLEERPFGGMGVHMMREFCDEIRYQRNLRDENELTLIKQINLNK